MSGGDRVGREGLGKVLRALASQPPRHRQRDTDTTRVHPLQVPCRTCRRGSISIFETGTSARGRRVPCPACSGTGFV